MPTRIIEIQVGQGWPVLHLKENEQGKAEPYAALSYCWGGEQAVKTTLDSIYRHRTRINIGDLSESIQGAIFTTIELGLRFIWIDALCIIQDDPLDKELEIATMPHVYSQATVTITASRAKGVEEGFLQDRVLNIPQMFKLPYKCPNGEIDTIIFFPGLEESSAPLDQRGWALQERLLSTRILEYGPLQTRWTCQENPPSVDHSDWWVDGWKLLAKQSPEKKDELFRETLAAIHYDARFSSDTSLVDLGNSIERWKKITEVYTRRSLTLSSDRLPAISGIAERFHKILCDDYCAGLWKSDIPRGLLWTPYSSSTRKPRPAMYQGPSWSWAAVDGPIKYFRSSSRAIDHGFQFLNCDIKGSFKARFGAIRSGSLVVRGRMQPAEWMPDEEPPRVRGQPGVLAFQMQTDNLEVGCAREGTVMVFLLILLSAGDENEDPVGLVLQKLESEQYSRIATFEFHDSYLDKIQSDESKKSLQRRYAEQIRWLNDCKPQTVTII